MTPHQFSHAEVGALIAVAEAALLCKGCGGTVGDHLAPDQGGCHGSFEINGVQMVPLAGRDNAEAQRDRAESELDADRKMRVEAEAALDERDCDVHARIRAGYDTTVADLWRAKVAKVESERDALKAKLAAAESAHSELFLSGQVAELRAKLAALVAAVDTEIDNVDHENYPLCGVHDGSRLIGRHLNGAECTCGVQKIRNAIAAARGAES